MASKTYNARISFRYNEQKDVTTLLCKFPGDDYFTPIAQKQGKVTEAEASDFVAKFVSEMRVNDILCNARKL